jgi:hypothetical protein
MMRECYCCKREFFEEEGSWKEVSKETISDILSGRERGLTIIREFICDNCKQIGG